MNEMIGNIKNHQEVLLYGKGGVARTFMQWLQFRHLDDYVKGFVVSQADNERVCMDRPVIEVSNVKLTYPGALIIVCVKNLYRAEIADMLSRYELSDYILLSDDMIKKCSIDVTHLTPRKSLKFEVHITEHCNLNCRGCFHCSPLAKEEFLSVEEFQRDCQRLSELYHGNLEYMELLGGEPLLHPDITEFFRVARTCFPKGTIALITNGILMPQMEEKFWIAAKEYNIEFRPTHYPIKVDYNAIQKKAEKYGIVYRPFAMVTDEAGNKILENYHFDIEGKQPIEENFHKCYRGNFCIFLSHGKMYSCVVGANLHHLKDYFGLKQIEILDNNGINIYDAQSADEISEFLTRPMQLCRYCKLTDEKTLIPFECSKKQLDEWI